MCSNATHVAQTNHSSVIDSATAVSASPQLCLKHRSLRDHISLEMSHAPFANTLLFLSSKEEFHPVSGLRKVLRVSNSGRTAMLVYLYLPLQ